MARAVSAELLGAADVVLVMTREHRAGVVQVVPTAVHRTFTVREAGRLATARSGSLPGGGPAERWRALVPQMAAGRGSVPTRSPRADDVTDPFGRAQDAYEQSAAELPPALTALLHAVAPTRP